MLSLLTINPAFTHWDAQLYFSVIQLFELCIFSELPKIGVQFCDLCSEWGVAMFKRQREKSGCLQRLDPRFDAVGYIRGF